jgi:DNA-directed RNA polymerase subunit RPC12/RpoP
MTSRTRHYIDLEDFLGLRFECNDCGTSIDVEIERAKQLPAKCPNCDRRWMTAPQGDMSGPATATYSLISRFLDDLSGMKNTMQGSANKPMFSLTLEVAPPVKTT